MHLLQCEHDFGVHQREERLDDFGGHGHDLGRGIEKGNPYPGGLGANSEQSGLAAANDVYFYVAAIGV